MQADFDIIRKKWNGISIEIRWTLDYITYDDGRSMTHLEIESLDRSPLPVAVNGYRSEFIPEADIVSFGGAEAYVDAWIDKMSHTPAWRENVTASRQLALL